MLVRCGSTGRGREYFIALERLRRLQRRHEERRIVRLRRRDVHDGRCRPHAWSANRRRNLDGVDAAHQGPSDNVIGYGHVVGDDPASQVFIDPGQGLGVPDGRRAPFEHAVLVRRSPPAKCFAVSTAGRRVRPAILTKASWLRKIALKPTSTRPLHTLGVDVGTALGLRTISDIFNAFKTLQNPSKTRIRHRQSSTIRRRFCGLTRAVANLLGRMTHAVTIAFIIRYSRLLFGTRLTREETIHRSFIAS